MDLYFQVFSPKDLIETIQRIEPQYYQGRINYIIHGTDSSITGYGGLIPNKSDPAATLEISECIHLTHRIYHRSRSKRSIVGP